MMTHRRILGAVAAWLCAAPAVALAQAPAPGRSEVAAAAAEAKAPPPDPSKPQADDTEIVAVRVTDVSGESIFLDLGKEAGIDSGQRVLLYSRTHGILTGTVRGAAKKSSNCTLDAGVALAVEIGTRGEVLIPKRKPGAVPPPEERPSRPEHPPWSAPPESWNGDNPLLRPAFSRPSSERPWELTGYTYVRGSYSTNQFGGGNEYYEAESGLDLSVLHAVPGEGVIKLRAEYLYQLAKLDTAPDSHEGNFRLDWFSCVWGGTRQDHARAEIGRFLQHEFSELGELDGAEAAVRIGDAFRVGGSAGAMPDYRRGLQSTGDYEGSVFAKFLSGAREEFSLGVTYQRTLHDGQWDRDLFVAVGELVPSQWFSARASVWMDYYTGSELVKSPGMELTEAHAYASYRFDMDNTLGLFFTHTRRPDILRDELAPPGQQLTPQLAEMLRENLSFYYGAYTWHRLSTMVVVDTRVTMWSDQTQQNGISGEGHIGFQDLLFDHGEIGFTAFYTDGIYTKGPGARWTISHLFAPVSFISWYEAAWYENTTTHDTSLQNAIHVSIDAPASETWTFSLSADYRFGFQQDAMTFLISIMKRI